MNNLTVLVDGGYLLFNCSSVFHKGFAINNSQAQKQRTADEFKDLLARTFVKIINQFPTDNIILMSEGGSWRKKLPVPKQLENIIYKGHRERNQEIDWDAIYNAYEEFTNSFCEYGFTNSRNLMIEGDDWAWYWSRRLNADGTNVIIWSSDRDLQQLVQYTNNSFTAWYNDRAGLVLHKDCEQSDDPIEFMMNPTKSNAIMDKVISKQLNVKYVNPDLIVVEKVLCGDAGDNIKSVIRYQKGERTYRFTEKDLQKLLEHIDIQSVKDLQENTQKISKYIVDNPKFEPYKFSKDDIVEMIEYNIKLVWLNEEVIPGTVTNAMVQEEYKQPDITPLKRNHKLLLEKNTSIEETFYSIFN